MAGDMSSSQVRFISICTDSDASLCSQIIEADGISGKASFAMISELEPQVADYFQTDRGNRAFIIDKYGILKEFSENTDKISQFILNNIETSGV